MTIIMTIIITIIIVIIIIIIIIIKLLRTPTLMGQKTSDRFFFFSDAVMTTNPTFMGH